MKPAQDVDLGREPRFSLERQEQRHVRIIEAREIVFGGDSEPTNRISVIQHLLQGNSEIQTLSSDM